MDTVETTKILAVLRGAYPSMYKDLGKDEVDGIISLWEEMFKDQPYTLVAAAVKAYISTDTKGFPPKIGEIKNAIHKVTHVGEMTEVEAWHVVKKACQYYTAQEEFDKLPELIKRLVGSPNQLREWAMMDAEKLETVVGSNFMRSYKARSQSQKEFDMLPESIKGIALNLAPKMDLSLLGSGEDD
jgi:hypothetical protein